MPEGDSLHRVARRLQALVGERIAAESPHARAQATGVAPIVPQRRHGLPASRGQGDDNRTAYWCPGCQGGAGPPGE